VQTFWVNLKRRSKYCPRFLFRQEAEANIGRAFFFRFQEEAVQAQHSFCCQVEANTVRDFLRYHAEANTGRAFFYTFNQRQILSALSFTVSSRGKYWPRILLSFIL
jgi:hypothetical protein